MKTITKRLRLISFARLAMKGNVNLNGSYIPYEKGIIHKRINIKARLRECGF